MIFSKTTAYGIRALVHMAGLSERRVCGLQEIAEQEEIPPVYLRKILGELRRHRLLRSVKGLHGGYELAKPADSITLWDVFSLLEPDPNLEMCLGKHCCAEEHTCGLDRDWQHVRDEIVELLHSKTIAQAVAAKAINEHHQATERSI